MQSMKRNLTSEDFSIPSPSAGCCVLADLWCLRSGIYECRYQPTDAWNELLHLGVDVLECVLHRKKPSIHFSVSNLIRSFGSGMPCWRWKPHVRPWVESLPLWALQRCRCGHIDSAVQNVSHSKSSWSQSSEVVSRSILQAQQIMNQQTSAAIWRLHSLHHILVQKFFIKAFKNLQVESFPGSLCLLRHSVLPFVPCSHLNLDVSILDWIVRSAQSITVRSGQVFQWHFAWVKGLWDNWGVSHLLSLKAKCLCRCASSLRPCRPLASSWQATTGMASIELSQCVVLVSEVSPIWISPKWLVCSFMQTQF